jgi:hypothetical protein
MLFVKEVAHGFITTGCVATPDAGLVKVAFILTAITHRHPIHEPRFPRSNGVTLVLIDLAALSRCYHPGSSVYVMLL